MNTSNFTLKLFVSTGSSAELSNNYNSMKAIKCILPMALFMLIGLIGQAQVSTETAAVNTKVKEATCQKVCAPAACATMVKLGLCTPEQAANCQKEGKNVKMASKEASTPSATKVAALSQKRTTSEISTSTSKTAECAKKCVKTCSGAKKEQ